jgi:hypothetical protein
VLYLQVMVDAMPPTRKIDRILSIILLLVILSVLAVSLYRFWYQKDFTVLTEASCDPAFSSCYVRDCNIDECPPNGLGEYRVFSVSAKDFGKCDDETCLLECTTQLISCREVPCTPGEDHVCSE